MTSQNIKIGFKTRHKTTSKKFFGCKTEFLSKIETGFWRFLKILVQRYFLSYL